MNNKTKHNYLIKFRESGVYDLYVDKKWVVSRGSYQSMLEELKNIIASQNKKIDELSSQMKKLAPIYYDKVEDCPSWSQPYVNKAIEIDPTFAKAYYNLGAAFHILNKPDDALINIGKALILFSKEKELDCKERCIKALNYIQDERKA